MIYQLQLYTPQDMNVFIVRQFHLPRFFCGSHFHTFQLFQKIFKVIQGENEISPCKASK